MSVHCRKGSYVVGGGVGEYEHCIVGKEIINSQLLYICLDEGENPFYFDTVKVTGFDRQMFLDTVFYNILNYFLMLCTRG